MLSSYNQEEVLQQVANGDQAAFTRLFYQHWDHLYSVAYSITRSAAGAEDIVQEIFIKVWSIREQLPGIEQFDNYLFVLARNHIFNALKKAAKNDNFLKNLLHVNNGAGPDADQQILYKESNALLQAAIHSLPTQRKLVYQLSREEGLTYEQIAERLGIAKSTVRNQMIKALAAIREQLAGHGGRALFILCMLRTF